MSNPLQTALAVLEAATGVTTLVSTRIYPLVAPQGVAKPYITLFVLSDDPENHLRGSGNLDQCRVIITAWSATYKQAVQISNAVRTAMEAAGYLSESRGADQFEPQSDPDPGLFHVERQFLMWLPAT